MMPQSLVIMPTEQQAEEREDINLAEFIIKLTKLSGEHASNIRKFHSDLTKVPTSDTDKARYARWLFHATKELWPTAHRIGMASYPFELAALLHNADTPLALNQGILGIHNLERMILLRESITEGHIPLNPDILNVNNSRLIDPRCFLHSPTFNETMRLLLLEHALREFIDDHLSKSSDNTELSGRQELYNKILQANSTIGETRETKQFKLDLAVRAETVLYDIGQKTPPLIYSKENYRYLSAIILRITFLLLTEAMTSNASFEVRAIVVWASYFFSSALADLTSLALYNTWWKEKYQHVSVSQKSLANITFLFSLFPYFYNNASWSPIPTTLVIFSLLTAFDMGLVISPVFSKLFNAKKWYVDKYPYMADGINEIIAAILQIPLIAMVIAFFNAFNISITNNSWIFLAIWTGITIFIMKPLASLLHIVFSYFHARHSNTNMAYDNYTPRSILDFFLNRASLLQVLSKKVTMAVAALYITSFVSGIHHMFPDKDYFTYINFFSTLVLMPVFGRFLQKLITHINSRPTLSEQTIRAYQEKTAVLYGPLYHPLTLDNFRKDATCARSFAKIEQTASLTAQTGRKELAPDYFTIDVSIRLAFYYLYFTFIFGLLKKLTDDPYIHFGIDEAAKFCVTFGFIAIELIKSYFGQIQAICIESNGPITWLYKNFVTLVCNIVRFCMGRSLFEYETVFLQEPTGAERAIDDAFEPEDTGDTCGYFGFFNRGRRDGQSTAVVADRSLVPSIYIVTP